VIVVAAGFIPSFVRRSTDDKWLMRSNESVVSPEGIEPARPRPQADGRVTEFFQGETN
jgi:hypothetical protein